MGIFRRSSTTATTTTPDLAGYPVREHVAWNDAGADELAAIVRDPARLTAAKVDTALARLAAVRQDPERQSLYLDVAADALGRGKTAEADFDGVRAALEAGPLKADDPAARADAYALLAECGVKAAWKVRSGKRAQHVDKDAWAVFHRMADEADEAGRIALELAPDHAGAASCRLWSGMGLGLSSAEWTQRFEVARRSHPTLYRAHTGMLQAMCRKWYGSHDTMFDFARTAAREAPPGDPVGAVLPYAHVEYWLDLDLDDEEQEAEVERARDADLPLVTQASDAWLSTGPTALAHPQAVEAHQLFGWFFVLAGDLPRGKRHLAQTGGRMSSPPWRYYVEPQQEYRTFLAGAEVPV